MKNRYEELFRLPDNLYIDKCPVLLKAGALFKDKASGKIFALLKFENICPKNISALFIEIRCFDIAHQLIGKVISFQYLDLTVPRGTAFGEQTPITISDNRVRIIEIRLRQIVFDDGEKYVVNDLPEPLPPLTPLTQTLQGQLYSQFIREIKKQYPASNPVYQPLRYQSIWICICSAINHDFETNCYRCNAKIDVLLHYSNPQVLQPLLAGYLEEEQQRIKQEQLATEKRLAEAKAKRRQVLTTGIKVGGLLLSAAIIFGVFTKVILPGMKYNKGMQFLEDGQHEEAASAFASAGHYRDAQKQLLRIVLEQLEPEHTVIDASHHTVGRKKDGTVVAIGFNPDGRCDVKNWKHISSIDAGGYHTVGLKTDGKVIAVGNNEHGQCNTGSWDNIIAVSAGLFHTVGITGNDTVVAVGNNDHGQCNVTSWSEIARISAGGQHTVGLKADGTVVAAGSNSYGQCNVDHLHNILAISAGTVHTVALKTDGTVTATGLNSDGRCNVKQWKNIVSIAAGSQHTLGLKKDGTVVATGSNQRGQCNVEDWRDIVAIAAGEYHSLGLKKDGTIVVAGGQRADVSRLLEWTDIGWSN